MIVHHAPRIQLQAFEVVWGEERWQLRAAEGCEKGRAASALKDKGKATRKASRSGDLTAFLIFGLLVLQDAQGQARVEAAELKGQQGQEAASEVCEAEQEEEEEEEGQAVKV